MTPRVDWTRVLVTDPAGRDLPEYARSLVTPMARHRVTAVLARWRAASESEMSTLVAELRRVWKGTLMVGQFPAVARQAGASGVHLGFGSVTVAEARATLGPGARVGRSVHTCAEATAAHEAGADYLLFGPILESPKPSHSRPPVGFDALAEVVAAVPIPVVAIGGLSVALEPRVLATGAAGWAAIRSLHTAAATEGSP